jgi:hypothetical protein
MYQYESWNSVLSLAVKQVGKRAVYINNGLNYDEHDDGIWNFVLEQVKEKYNDDPGMKGDLIHGGLFFFDNEEEQYKFYDIFNAPATDSSALYALTFDEHGNSETENT